MTLADAVSLRSRRRKLRLFLEEMGPTAATTVVDVGADEVGFGGAGGQDGCATHNFFEELYPWREQITAVGLDDGTGFRERYPQIPYVQGDGCALPFADNAFDIYFSNAVIEHVGGTDRQRGNLFQSLMRMLRQAHAHAVSDIGVRQQYPFYRHPIRPSRTAALRTRQNGRISSGSRPTPAQQTQAVRQLCTPLSTAPKVGGSTTAPRLTKTIARPVSNPTAPGPAASATVAM